MSAADQIVLPAEKKFQTMEKGSTKKKTANKEPLLTASKEEKKLPVAFLMLEAREMSTNSGCLSRFSISEDKTYFLN